jgi:hypothetical protein
MDVPMKNNFFTSKSPLDSPVYIRYQGRLYQNGILADYRGRPVPRSADRRMKFDLREHGFMSIHQAVREIASLEFSKEQKRLFRVYCSEHYGLPLREEDRWPIN